MQRERFSYIRNVSFDFGYPTPGEIQSKFGDRFVDLNKYLGLRHTDVVDAFLNSQNNHYLIIPRDERKYRFWDKSTIMGLYDRKEIQLDTAYKFNKFGPEVDLNKSSMTNQWAIENNFLPITTMKQKAKEMDIELAYRGFGYWGSKQHKLIPFDFLVESQIFVAQFEKDIEELYHRADPRYRIPSRSRINKRYDILLKLSATGDQYIILWMKTHGNCNCEDKDFREMRSTKNQMGELIGIQKYSNGESIWCVHELACSEKALIESSKPDKIPIRVRMVPKLNELSRRLWFVMKNHTIVADEDGKNARKLTKTEDRISWGRIMSHIPEEIFAW
jgi:hypothetical protein